MRTFLILGVLLICGVVATAQEPLGDPNEVWVTCSAGNTIFVGQPVELEIHLANAEFFDALELDFRIYSENGAKWVWLPQDDSSFSCELDTNILSGQPNSRLMEALNVAVWSWLWWLPSDSGDAFMSGGYSSASPSVVAGPLEHSYSMHFMATETGTICLDSYDWEPTHDRFHFFKNGNPITPSWNGPFCFEVVESTALGDVNCDGQGNVGDIVYLINWVFKNGPPPCK